MHALVSALMKARSLHLLEQYVCAVNASVAFSVKYSAKAPLPAQIQSALVQTTRAIPVLSCAFTYNEEKKANIGDRLAVMQDCLEYCEQASHDMPVGSVVSSLLVEEARRTTDETKYLFALKAVQYANGLIFYLVVNHSITDGTSVFSIVDTFLQYLAAEVDGTELQLSVPAPSERDLVGELLSDARCSSETHPLFAESYPDMLKFPAITASNVDAINNGCMRVIYR